MSDRKVASHKGDILVVDDIPANLHLLSQVLTEQGYKARAVTSGARALEAVRANPPDLILLDIIMPEMSGYEVCRLLKADAQSQDIPIIFISALDATEDKVQAFAAGGVDYVTKPLQSEEVLARVETHLALRDLQRDLQERNSQLQQEIATRKQAESTLRQRNRELALLNQAGQAFTSSLDLDEIFTTILEEVRNLLGAFASSIWLIDPETGDLVCQQATGPKSELVSGWRLRQGQGVVGWVVLTGESLIVLDTRSDQRHFQGVGQEIGRELRSLLCVPLQVKERTIGALEIVDEKADRFIEADQVLLESLAAAASIAIENARLVEGLEAEVVARTKEIVAERDKSMAILHSVADGIATVDMDMNIQYINNAFTHLTGYTASEALAQQMRVLIGQRMLDQDWQSLRLAQATGEDWYGETTIQRKDGRVYDAMLTIAPMRDAEGELVGYVTSHRDISQRKDMDRARSRFLDNVSHQLRTPVTTLQLYAHLLLQKDLPEEVRHHVQTMEHEIAHLIHLIQDSLEMTVLDSGKAVTLWEPISLLATIEDCFNRHRDHAEGSGLILTVMPFPTSTPIVRGDEARLAQALDEVVDNAINFDSPGGQVTLAIDTVEDEEQTWVTIGVQDTGPGISPEEQEKVFDRFFRGEIAESGHIPGTGLGLSIAQEIVRAHGGKITVESQLGEGTTFTIWLPSAE
jgi:PAS domain S-box-containing protein